MPTQNFFDLKLTKPTPGKVVRGFRRNFKLTQQELAQVTGIAETNLSAIENDKVELGVRRAVLIAAAFGVDPSLILFPHGYVAPYESEVRAVQAAATRLKAKKKVG